jgi:hypothetical protein
VKIFVIEGDFCSYCGARDDANAFKDWSVVFIGGNCLLYCRKCSQRSTTVLGDKKKARKKR